MKPRASLAALRPYVPGRTIASGIKLSSNENPLGSSPRALAAIRRAVECTPVTATGELNRYPDGSMIELTERLALFWEADTDMFVVGNGSDEIMAMIAGAFIEPGLNAVTARHTFSLYTFATIIFGGSMRYAEMTSGNYDLRAIVGKIDSDTRLVFLCNPNNPTSTAFTHDDLVTFLRAVPDHVVVVVDEAYGEFADATVFPRTMELITQFPNLIRLRTFSKIYGLAGLRIGYGTAQQELVGVVSTLRQPFNVGTVAQKAAAAALDDRKFVDRSIENNIAGRVRLTAALDRLGIDHYRSEANFVCAHLPSPTEDPPGSRSTEVTQRLAERHITVRHLASFGLPDHIRISVGNPTEVTAVCEAMAEVVAAGYDHLPDRSETGPS